MSNRAGMAELADAADLKSAALKRAWGFESPSRHQNSLAQKELIGSARLAWA